MNALVIFVPKKSEENYRHGIENGIWGFRELGDSQKIKSGDIIIFARGFSGGSPRKALGIWLKNSVKTLAVSVVVGDYAEEDRIEWPDEKQKHVVKYPHRVRFRIPVREMNDVRLAELDEQVVDAMRRSGIANGRANVVVGLNPRGLSLEPNEQKEGGDPVPEENRKIAKVSPVKHILAYISAAGFNFSSQTIRAFYAAVLAKPFVILAGNSGTGKSRLVRLFAEACGATAENGGFHLVAIRPDWSDGGELLGYRDLQDTFRPGQLLDPLLRAHAHPQRPVFVCLDEMNLARVEHYFSDFLSKIESRRRAAGGRVISDAVISAGDLDLLMPANVPKGLRETLGRLKAAKKGIHLPPNFIIVGTVNMDETTHAFSRKVLDRANTLEIEAGKLNADLPGATKATSSPVASPPVTIDLTAPFLIAQDIAKESKHAEALVRVATLLDELNDILSEANLQVAYRTRDEAAAFFIHATEAGLSAGEAEHAIMMQKILPRVQGSSPRLARILEKLLRRFHPSVTVEASGDKLNDDLLALRRNASLPPLVRKLASMWLVYQEEGFTSFWVA